MRSTLVGIVTTTFTISLAGCAGEKPTPQPADALSQLTQAANEMAAQAKQLAGGTSGDGQRTPVPPVSYKVLLGYLPQSLDDMAAKEPEGETASAGQWQYSQAKVVFRSTDGSRSAQVGVFDYAHIPILYLPYQMMLRMKVSRESTTGYERTVEVKGFPAFEKWDQNTGESEISVMVGDRFVVTTSTRGSGEGSARTIVEGIDLKDLAKQSPG